MNETKIELTVAFLGTNIQKLINKVLKVLQKIHCEN